MQPLFDEKVRLPKLDTLRIVNMDNWRKLWQDDQHNLDSFSKLREIWLENCNKLLNIFPSIMSGRLQRLEILTVRNCDSLEEIFERQALRGRETNVITASQLKVLELDNLPNLKHVWNMHNRVILGFRYLHKVKVCNCNNLESIFPASIARDLLELQALWIDSCMMDEIVHKEEEDVEAVLQFIFPQLAFLVLADLPRIRCLYTGIHISDWPALKYLAVIECTKVKILASELPTRDLIPQPPLSLVDKVAFPSLKELFLVDCKRIEQIIRVTDWEDEVKDEIDFRELEYLRLERLPTLGNFCLGNCSLEFPSLEKLRLIECPKMESFSQGNLSTPKLQRLQRTEHDDDEGYWKGDLNATIQQIFKETICYCFFEPDSKK